MGLFSAITGVIGAAQSASAYSNAAGEIGRGLNQSADTVDRTVGYVNPAIGAAASTAGRGVEDAANGAAVGVLNATEAAQTGVNGAAGSANEFLNPYIDAGRGAVTSLSNLVNDGAKFTFSEDDPSYQWRMKEGQKAIERSAAARGGAQGGGTLKALTQYAQGLASTEYGAAFDRFERSRGRQFSELSTLASGGLQASGQAGRNLTGAAEYSGNVGVQGEQIAGGLRTGAAQYSGDRNVRASEITGQNSMNAGLYRASAERGIADAKASSFIGRANAWNNGLQQIGSGVDGFVSGGIDGGKGFSWGDAFRGYSKAA